MAEDDPGKDSFEDMIRSIVREIERSVENVRRVDLDEIVARVDLDEIAGVIGVDPDRARRWVDSAGQWLRAQTQSSPGDVEFREHPGADAEPNAEPLRSTGPNPLDMPTPEQGRALAALDSGRWTVEPGTHALGAHGEGAAPSDAEGLVGELRARDWIGADGQLTIVGRHALSRWLDAAGPHHSQS